MTDEKAYMMQKIIEAEHELSEYLQNLGVNCNFSTDNASRESLITFVTVHKIPIDTFLAETWLPRQKETFAELAKSVGLIPKRKH